MESPNLDQKGILITVEFLDHYEFWAWLTLSFNFIFNFKTYFSNNMNKLNHFTLVSKSNTNVQFVHQSKDKDHL